MTANELADINEWSCCAHSKEVSTMLRQQDKKIKELQDDIASLTNDFLFTERKEVARLEAEIEALKKELALQKLSDIGQEIENEPVAHRFKWEEKMSWQYGDGYDATGAPNDPDYFAYEPLYTHTNEDRDSAIYATGYWNGIAKVKPRELTDEEIVSCIDESEPNTTDMIRFARTVLMKASEKC